MNTDEFEGHTLDGLTPELLVESGFEAANAKLIAAAPDLLAEVNRLREVERWAQAHHAKCEDGCGAACVPSEEEVERFHETGDWEEEE